MSYSSPVGAISAVGQERQAVVPVVPKALEEAVSKLNASNATGVANEIVVTMNGSHLLIQVVNRETHEVVGQVSPPSIFRMSRDLDEA